MQHSVRNPKRTVFLWLCLIVYLMLLLKIILFKFPVETIINIINDQDELNYTRVNLMPFQTIRFYVFSGRVSNHIAMMNIWGNILAFAPLGVLIPLIRRKCSLLLTFFCGLALSLGIELTQYATGLGSADIDDIILNVLGAMLTGITLFFLDACAFLLKKALQRKFKRKKKPLDK